MPEIHTEGGDVCEGGNSGEVASSQTQATQACAEASFGMKSIPQLALPPLQLPTAISIQAAGAASVVMAGAVRSTERLRTVCLVSLRVKRPFSTKGVMTGNPSPRYAGVYTYFQAPALEGCWAD